MGFLTDVNYKITRLKVEGNEQKKRILIDNDLWKVFVGF